jgi:hypothetical protein
LITNGFTASSSGQIVPDREERVKPLKQSPDGSSTALSPTRQGAILIIGLLRPRAAQGFEDFFSSQARDVYPRYDFARMADDEYGAALALG